MELSWLMRFRIAAAMAVGVVLLGILPWPMIRPSEPLGPVTLFSGDINIASAAICLVLAFLSGLGAYFAAFPYGRQIAPLAAPAGVALWAVRSGDMACLLRLNHSLQQRQQVYAMLKWEGFFWLAIVAAGYLGVVTADRLFTAGREPDETKPKQAQTFNNILSIGTAMLATLVIAHYAIGLLAQDVRMYDRSLGSVVGQPGTGQIFFAVMVAFALAAYVVKKFLNVSYIWPVIASAAFTVLSIQFFAEGNKLAHMVENWPVAFFARASCAILPIQIVAFAAIGSVAGHWFAVKYADWRTHAH